MKRILTKFKRSESQERLSRSGSGVASSSRGVAAYHDDSPEGIIIRAIKDFCESGGPQSKNAGEEVLHLPSIVDSAESSPTAAKKAATIIRKYLDPKNNASRPHVQYNAIMLMRILADNPGRTFTRNLAEPKFASTVKDLLRQGRDPSVQQIMSETLEHFEVKKADDEGLRVLKEMWVKEKKVTVHARAGNAQGMPPPQITPRPVAMNQNGLPTMEELVSRISEAQTSAKLLNQVLQSTPTTEVSTNDLVKEFAERCRAASRSMQAYIVADNPAPDEDTLITLIETNELLTMALNRHQTAVQTAVEKSEIYRTENARLIDIGDPEAPAGPPVPIRVNTASANSAHRNETAVVPDSPVSPVTPQQPVAYRY
ncbi:hypothetical protein RUND412_010219 [Rhizina undulata]